MLGGDLGSSDVMRRILRFPPAASQLLLTCSPFPQVDVDETVRFYEQEPYDQMQNRFCDNEETRTGIRSSSARGKEGRYTVGEANKVQISAFPFIDEWVRVVLAQCKDEKREQFSTCCCQISSSLPVFFPQPEEKSSQNKHSCYFLLIVIISDTQMLYIQNIFIHLVNGFCLFLCGIFFHSMFKMNTRQCTHTYIYIYLSIYICINHHRKPCAFKRISVSRCELTAICIAV